MLQTFVYGVLSVAQCFLCLALDDVPSELVHDLDRDAFGSLGDAHAELTAEVAAELGSEVTLWLVPTDYAGIDSSAS